MFYIFIWVYRITLGKEREGEIFTELWNLRFIFECHKILSKYLLQLSINRGKAATVRRIYTVTDQKFQASTILTNWAFLPNVVIDVISRSNIKRKRVSILLSASSLCINFFLFSSPVKSLGDWVVLITNSDLFENFFQPILYGSFRTPKSFWKKLVVGELTEYYYKTIWVTGAC